jgi:nitrite reductase/ring-hydroxylating ferredoxin subunit
MTSLSRARTSALVSVDSFVPVGPAADIRPGHPHTVVIDGREIAIFNAGGTFYALENACPHQGAPLSDGWIEGKTVTCTWHAWCFSLEDGRMSIGGRIAVDTFDVRVDPDGTLSVSRTPRPLDG